MLVISESGLFTVILRCRDALKKGTLPHRFRRWVTGEVLPSLRTKGGQEPSPPPTIVPAGLAIRTVNAARHAFGVRVAQQMWVKLGLPTVPAMLLRPDQGEMFVPMMLPPPEGGATAH